MRAVGFFILAATLGSFGAQPCLLLSFPRYAYCPGDFGKSARSELLLVHLQALLLSSGSRAPFLLWLIVCFVEPAWKEAMNLHPRAPIVPPNFSSEFSWIILAKYHLLN
ncbi:uncharacterized protein BKA55DRAFT_585018 [Fusarium redolens]|uniref:Uncharacterized protein n=1 Tax=Fusarium redolens TaxID=48865 RepID=A0A9P9JL73_FUSRE|nr:uncharacterized protein BKA55DRAFT_585018 [Fusarium redolens]KAH7220512.1 hypothetical protein BKA55DRAFT_585018 [Fusarium redolens]